MANRPYMALECLSGEKLARRTAGNCLAPHDALSLGRQIAKAMIAAHRVGFVHGGDRSQNNPAPA